jgi:hypothetical protein
VPEQAVQQLRYPAAAMQAGLRKTYWVLAQLVLQGIRYSNQRMSSATTELEDPPTTCLRVMRLGQICVVWTAAPVTATAAAAVAVAETAAAAAAAVAVAAAAAVAATAAVASTAVAVTAHPHHQKLHCSRQQSMLQACYASLVPSVGLMHQMPAGRQQMPIDPIFPSWTPLSVAAGHPD